MPLPEVGLNATIENLNKFEAGAITIVNVYNDIDKKANEVEKSTGGLGKSFLSLGDTMLGFGAIAAGVGVAALGGLVTGLGGAAASGLQMNNSMEQAEARINAFTKDAAETDRILEELNIESAKTPFTFRDMTDAAASLLPATKASGESLDELIDTAEILAASNPLEGLEGASFSLKEAITGDFTSIIERFNLSRTTINQLKDEGVPNMEIVRLAMQEMGLDMDLVTALAATAEGRWSTFTDTLQMLAATITQPIFDLFSDSLGVINDLLVANAPLLESLATALSEDIANAISVVVAYLGAFETGGTTGLLAVLGVTPELTELLDKVVTSMTSIAMTITDLFAPAVDGLVSGGALDMLNEAIEFVNQHWAEFEGALIGIGITLAAAGTVAAIAGVVSIVAALANPVTLIIAVAALLGAAWGGNWGGIQEKTMAVWAVVQPILSQIGQWLGELLIADIQNYSTIFSAAWDIMMAVGNWMSVNLLPLLISIGNVFNAIINKAVEASAGLWQNVLHPALIAVGDYLSTTFGPAFEAIGTFLTETLGPILDNLGLVQLPNVGGAFSSLTGFFNSFAGAISTFELPPELTPGSLSPFEMVLQGMSDILTGPLDGALTKFAEESQPAIRTLHQLLLSTLTPVLQGIADNVVFIFTTWADSVPPLVEAMFPLNTIAENTGASLDMMAASLNTIASALASVASSTAGAINQLTGLNNLDLDDITEEAEFLEDAVEDVETAFEDAKTAAVKLENVEFNSLIGWLEDVNTEIQKAIRGFNDMVQAAEDAAQAPGVGGASLGVFSPDLFMSLAGGGAGAVSGPTTPVVNNVTNIFMTNDFGGNTISSGMGEAQFDAMVLASLQRLAG